MEIYNFIRWFSKFYENRNILRQLFVILSIYKNSLALKCEVPQKMCPDRFSRFDVYRLQTNKHSDKTFDISQIMKSARSKTKRLKDQQNQVSKMYTLENYCSRQMLICSPVHVCWLYTVITRKQWNSRVFWLSLKSCPENCIYA